MVRPGYIVGGQEEQQIWTGQRARYGHTDTRGQDRCLAKLAKVLQKFLKPPPSADFIRTEFSSRIFASRMFKAM